MRQGAKGVVSDELKVFLITPWAPIEATRSSAVFCLELGRNKAVMERNWSVECSARFPFRSLERRLVLQLCTTAGCERAAISLGETNAHFPGSPVQAKVLAKYDVVVCTTYNYTLHHFLRVRSHVFAPFDPLAHWCKYLYLYILYLKRMSCIYIYISLLWGYCLIQQRQSGELSSYLSHFVPNFCAKWSPRQTG